MHHCPVSCETCLKVEVIDLINEITLAQMIQSAAIALVLLHERTPNS